MPTQKTKSKCCGSEYITSILGDNNIKTICKRCSKDCELVPFEEETRKSECCAGLIDIVDSVEICSVCKKVITGNDKLEDQKDEELLGDDEKKK